MQSGPVPGTVLHQTIEQNHELDTALDNVLIEQAHDALENGTPVRITADIRNVNRTVGTMLGYEITRRYGEEGLPDNTIDLTLNGTGGNPSARSFRVARRFASSVRRTTMQARACPAAAW